VPGDLVEVDTLDVRPLPGMVFKHFTARDVISRWDVLEVRSRATATLPRPFLTAWWRGCRSRYAPSRSTAVRSSTPPSKPSASAAACACSCCRRARPNSIGAVERAQHTHTEEFYQLRPFNSFTVEGLNREARGWERIYNTVYQTGSTPDWLDGASATSDRCADTSGLDRDIRNAA